jgi:predicted metal-binding membrane protein
MSAALPAGRQSTEHAPGGRTWLEVALGHDRLMVLSGLSLVAGLSWYWILAMSADMYGAMRGASAWAMSTTWDVPHLLLLVAMWAVMMIAMMLPSAVPLLMLYISVVRRTDPRNLARQSYVLVAGYLATWTLFGAAAAVTQRLLTESDVISPMMDLASVRLASIFLIAAGAYQFSPFKRDCLAACRAPVTLLTRHWQPGSRGAFRMGLRHGRYCVGCCWTLMLLLFVGGVMNAYVIGGLTLFVLIEKATAVGAPAARLGGAVLIALGVWLLVR